MRSRRSRPKFILSRSYRLTDRFVSVSLVSNLDLNLREAPPPPLPTSIVSFVSLNDEEDDNRSEHQRITYYERKDSVRIRI